MEKKHTDKKNYLSARIKWCALLAAELIGAVLVEMWTVCIREMRPFTIPAVFTVLFVLLAAAVHRLVLVPYRETRKIYEQFVMGYVMEDLFKVRYPFSPESEQAILRLNEIIDRSNLIAISKKQAEYLALQNQINPHFLYNTLDTIYMLARINGEETTMKMIQALSKYLRLSLSKGSDIVTVEDELENVKSYMEIQQIRNANLFRYEIECKVEEKSTWMLKLILQPLVENAIKHGFCEIYENGLIRIEIAREDSQLKIVVFNNGKPIDREMMEKINALNGHPILEAKKCFQDKEHGYGVVNVLTRLRLKYGEDVLFYYEAEENGTRCTIQIPDDGKEKRDL